MEQQEKKALQAFAVQIRMAALYAIHSIGSGHVGGAMSIADALAVLYGREMNVRPDDPQWPERDKLVLSKGHAGPAVYGTLALKGYFPYEELATLNRGGTRLPSHCDRNQTPGIDMSTGSLGQGLSAAVGMALSAKITGKLWRTYAICGDGELAEGQIWEAMMAAAKWKLDNLCAFIDVNGLQIDGATKDVMPTEPLDKKLEAFNWHVVKIDGHDFSQILAALAEARKTKGKPTAILMATVKGKGVSFMENQAGWHGKAPNADEFAISKAELEAKIKELEGK